MAVALARALALARAQALALASAVALVVVLVALSRQETPEKAETGERETGYVPDAARMCSLPRTPALNAILLSQEEVSIQEEVVVVLHMAVTETRPLLVAMVLVHMLLWPWEEHMLLKPLMEAMEHLGLEHMEDTVHPLLLDMVLTASSFLRAMDLLVHMEVVVKDIARISLRTRFRIQLERSHRYCLAYCCC